MNDLRRRPRGLNGGWSPSEVVRLSLRFLLFRMKYDGVTVADELVFCFCFNGGKKSEIGPTRADPDVHFDPLDLQAQLFFWSHR